MVDSTARISPSVSWNVAAMLSIRAGGGSSATKRCASSFEINRAVEGCARQNIQHFLAVLFTAAGRNGHAEHCFLALVVRLLVEDERTALVRLSMLQPVKQRATSMISCCV